MTARNFTDSHDSMNILMIAPQPFFEPRGTPMSVYDRLRALSDLGHQVDLVTYHVGEDIQVPGVHVLRTLRIPFIKSVKIGPSWAKLFLDVLLFVKCFLILTTKRYDVIHTHEEAAFFGMILAAIFRTPHLYDMHSSLPRQLENIDRWGWRPFIVLFDLFEQLVLKTCNAVIPIDEDLAKYVIRRAPKANYLIVDNLAAHSRWNLSEPDDALKLRREMHINGRLPVVYTGSFENYQGLELLFESAKIVCQHEPKALFVLVGGNPDQIIRAQEKTRKYQIEESICFVGIVPPGEAIAYMGMADVLVSPRLRGSSTPLKIYSYLHSGKPIVATKIGAHTQILSEEIAVLAEPNKESFAHAILQLLQNSDLGSALGERAKQLADEKYNYTDYLAKVRKIYETLCPPACGPDESSQLI
jgi:glycosyltransferase involved in cell wall biosynthesis